MSAQYVVFLIFTLFTSVGFWWDKLSLRTGKKFAVLWFRSFLTSTCREESCEKFLQKKSLSRTCCFLSFSCRCLHFVLWIKLEWISYKLLLCSLSPCDVKCQSWRSKATCFLPAVHTSVLTDELGLQCRKAKGGGWRQDLPANGLDFPTTCIKLKANAPSKDPFLPQADWAHDLRSFNFLSLHSNFPTLHNSQIFCKLMCITLVKFFFGLRRRIEFVRIEEWNGGFIFIFMGEGKTWTLFKWVFFLNLFHYACLSFHSTPVCLRVLLQFQLHFVLLRRSLLVFLLSKTN